MKVLILVHIGLSFNSNNINMEIVPYDRQRLTAINTTKYLLVQTAN
jgi:hypothetical protein